MPQSVIFSHFTIWNIHSFVFPQLPVRSCAVVMASTPGGAVSATAAGRAPNVTFRPPSVSILNAVDTDCVWRVTVCATPATRDPTANKVNGGGVFSLDWKLLDATYFCVKPRGNRHSSLVKQSVFSTLPSR